MHVRKYKGWTWRRKASPKCKSGPHELGDVIRNGEKKIERSGKKVFCLVDEEKLLEKLVQNGKRSKQEWKT